NHAAASLARQAADDVTTPDRPRFVAGSLGPTSKTASISPDVNDPGARNVTFDDLVAAYLEEARGLVDGGADLLLVETSFDTPHTTAPLSCWSRRSSTPSTPRPLSSRSRPCSTSTGGGGR